MTKKELEEEVQDLTTELEHARDEIDVLQDEIDSDMSADDFGSYWIEGKPEAKQAIKQLIDSKVREARDATRRLYDKELEMHRGFMASVLTRENLKTNVTLTLCSRCSTELTKAKEVK